MSPVFFVLGGRLPVLAFDVPFIRAAHFTVSPRKIDLVVLHSMESPEKPGTARAVANWFAGPNAPQASAHYCVDADEVVQCVLAKDIAWAAPGANRNGIHIEHAGRAAQTADEWRDEFSMATLHRSIELTARLCKGLDIPAKFVDAAGLLVGGRGITTHAEVTRAYKTPGGHTDPGIGFPLLWYVDRVASILSEAA